MTSQYLDHVYQRLAGYNVSPFYGSAVTCQQLICVQAGMHSEHWIAMLPRTTGLWIILIQNSLGKQNVRGYKIGDIGLPVTLERRTALVLSSENGNGTLATIIEQKE